MTANSTAQKVERSQRIADEIERLRVSFMGSLIQDRDGWSWKYSRPRGGWFCVVVNVFGPDGRSLLRQWIEREHAQAGGLWSFAITTSEHWVGCEAEIRPVLVDPTPSQS